MARTGRLAAGMFLLLALAGGSARLAAQQPAQGVLRGTVVNAEGGDRLAFALVMLEPGPGRRFASETGDFLFTGLAEGRYRLTVRQVGFHPFDTTLTVRSSTPPLRVALVRVPVQLVALRVSATGRCTAPGPPDPELQPELATVFEQLTLNAQRHQLLVDQYPFRFTIARELITNRANGMATTERDTVSYRSDGRWPYRPGGVVTDDPYRPGWRAVHFPLLADLADSTFQATHCFRYAGIDTVAGTPLLQVDFRVASSVHEPDVDGSAFLDPQTYQVRQTTFTITRVYQAANGVSDYLAQTWFSEVRPNLILVDRVEATTTMAPTPGRASATSHREIQRLLRVDFVRPLPGTRDSLPRS